MNIYVGGSAGEYHFYTDGGLYFCVNGGKKSLLCENCLDEFDVCAGNEINLVCESREGDIFKFTKSGGEWIKSVLLKSRSRCAAVFGMRIMETNDDFHFIYGLNHGDEMLVVHQVLPYGQPQVISKIYDENFFVRRDETGCIYILCKISENLWHFFTYRSGGWSASEELCEGGEIRDVMCTAYKQFCIVKEDDGKAVFENGGESFAVPGTDCKIAATKGGFIVFSKVDGRVIYTSKEKSTGIISGGNCIDFHLRLPFGGEYCVCECCPGTLRQGKPKLFVLGNSFLAKGAFGESARIEITKQTIALEAKIDELEKRIEKLETNSYNPQ